MKKAINVIALFAVLLIAVSAHTERLFSTAVSKNAPALSVVGCDSSATTLADLKGNYVLVNFWASTDAESRIAAKNYDTLAGTVAEEQLRLLAVNCDQSDRLFREIIRRDGLNATAQHRAAESHGSNTPDLSRWHLENGLKSYLIDPQGRIVAINPTVESLLSQFGS